MRLALHLLLVAAAALAVVAGVLRWVHVEDGVREAHGRAAVLEGRVRRLPPPVDTAPLEADIATCLRRTEDMRMVLEVLIRTDRWPGREALPAPLADWPRWPPRGASVGSITMPDLCGWPPVACVDGGLW